MVANIPFNISTNVIKQLLPMGDIFSEVVLLLQVGIDDVILQKCCIFHLIILQSLHVAQWSTTVKLTSSFKLFFPVFVL